MDDLQKAHAILETKEFTREDLFALHKELSDKARELMQRKNADYSKTATFGNFYLSEALQCCSAENGIINRTGDKLSRLVSILSKGSQVKEESIEDTIVDVINYMVLLAGVIRDKKLRARQNTPA